MGSSFSDPQFYIVTAIALLGLWLVLRPFLRRSKEQKRGCPTCTTCSVTKGGDAAAGNGSSAGLVRLGSGRS